MLFEQTKGLRPGHASQDFGWLTYACLALLLAFTAVTVGNRITDRPPTFDGRHNLTYAYNLAKYGVYSHGREDDPDRIEPTMRREPFYPAVLALWMKAVLDLVTTDLECLLSSEEQCKATRELLKWPLWFCLMGITVLTFVAGSRLSGSSLVGLASACFVGLNPHYLLFVDRFYTEIPAALLLLIHCYALTHLSRERSTWPWLTAAVSLGLLILTKAAFYYWLILLVPVLLALILVRKVHWKSVAVFLIAASILPGLWITRNTVSIGEPHLASRGSVMLAIRAEYTTMSWPEYWTAYLYYTPIIRAEAIRIFGKERFARFDRQNPEGYYRRAKNGGGVVNDAMALDETGKRELAIRVLIENWSKQLALIPLLAYRGLLQLDDSRRFLIQTTLPAWGFLLGSILAMWAREKRFLLFVLPAWYSIAFHATLTDYIPRFSWPLVPITTVCAFWTGWEIVRRLMPRAAEIVDSKLS